MTFDILKNDFVFYDGGMGTMLQKNGLRPGEYPDLMNLTAPFVVEQIQRMYFEAGSDIICTNTFGSNERNLKASGYSIEAVIKAGVEIAKRAGKGKTLTALDIGPVGSFMEPSGNLTFDEAYELFCKQATVGEAAGADLVAIETMSDLGEMRAAILAVKENTNLPVFATMTFGKSGRTLTGCIPESFAVVAEGLGADAVGINCSLAPNEIFPIAKRLAENTNLPLIIKPNAGLPDSKTGAYDMTPEEFARQMEQYASIGVKIVGGCCGTTPDYIRELRNVFNKIRPTERKENIRRCICSSSRIAYIEDNSFTNIPEMAIYNESDIISSAEEQAENEAEILHIRIPENMKPQTASEVVKEIQGLTSQPLHIISSDPAVLEAVLRSITGKAAVSCPEDREDMKQIIKKYGALMVHPDK